MQRVIAQGDLPPMVGSDAAMADLRRILATRAPGYRKAVTVVDTSTANVESSCARLCEGVTP
jgi:hypothetical protein